MKKGNLVRVNGNDALFANKFAVIDGGEDGAWSVMLMDDGNRGHPYSDEELEFIDDGGEFLIEKAFKAKEECEKRETDLKWIVKNWDTLKVEMSTTTAAYLLKELGFKMVDELPQFVLILEWRIVFPAVNDLVTAKDWSEIEQKLVHMSVRDKEVDASLRSLFERIKEVQRCGE